MSTQFYSAATGEWVGTRYYRGNPDILNFFTGEYGKGPSFDFGADHVQAFELRERAVDSREVFVDENGARYTGVRFWYAVVCDAQTWTFGEFGGSFEVGSGDIARFGGIITPNDLERGDREDT